MAARLGKGPVEAWCNFTRLDLTIDSEGEDITFKQVHEAVKNRDFVCRSNTLGIYGKRNWPAALCMLGSLCILRGVYDPGFKTKAGYSFLRLECELTKDRADAVPAA